MKRLLALVLSAAMILALTACDGGTAADTDTPNASYAAQGGPVTLAIGTSGLGGNFFTMGASIAAVLVDKLGYQAVAQATAGSAANLDSIHNGELDIAIAQASSVSAAVLGQEQFEGAALDDITTLVNYSATPIHFYAKRSANIKSISDLAGKKVECLNPGDGVEMTTKQMLPFYDLSLDDIQAEYSGNRVQAGSRFKTGELDAMLDATGIGNSWVTDIMGDGSVYEILSFTDEEIEAFCAEYPFFSKMVIPANTYAGQTEDVQTVGIWTVVVADKDLDEEVAYNIVKTMFDNKEELVKAHNFFKDMEPENITTSLSAPLHPGAEKYYKEIGVIQ